MREQSFTENVDSRGSANPVEDNLNQDVRETWIIMRIGFGISAWANGLNRRHLDGISVYTRNLWRALETMSCDLHNFRFGNCNKDPSGLPTHICLPCSFKILVAYSSITGLPFFNTRRLENEVDLIHATDHHIPKLRRTPVIATIQDAIPLVHPEWSSSTLRQVKNFAFKHTAHWCDRIITSSQHSKRDISTYFDIAPERIDVVPLGVSEAFFDRASEETLTRTLQTYDIKRGCFIFIGTLQPRKNLRRIIEAYRHLPSYIRVEHPLLIIGKYGWGDDALRQELLKLQHEGHGFWLTDVSDEDMRTLLQSAAALLYPSLYEGFGLPVLEGFASGIPVITSNTTSIPEVAGDAALLVDPESVDEIANAMERVIVDTQLKKILIEKGLVRARMFTWKRCAEQTLAIYQKVSGNA